MTRINVKVNDIDETTNGLTPLFYRSRTITLQSGSKSIETPTRAISRTEFNAKKQVPVSVPIFYNNHILCDYHKLDLKEANAFLNNNEGYKKIFSRANNVAKNSTYALISPMVIQPCKRALSLLNTESLCNKFIRMNFAMQFELKKTILTIPYLGQFETPEFLDKILREIEKNMPESDPMIILDLAHNESNFRKIIDLVKEKNESDMMKLLGLIYHKYTDVASNYDYAWSNLRESNLCIFMQELKRQDFDDNVSIPHYSEYTLGDVYCTENPRVFFDKSRPTKINIKFFNRASLTVDPISEQMPCLDQVIRDLETFSNQDAEFVRKIIEDHSDEEKLKRLSYLSKVHEISASNREFEISRKYIGQNDSRTYLEKKNPFMTNS